jgi:hypothetical protein
MKKLIIILLFIFSVPVFSQMFTGTVDTTRKNIVSLFTATGDTITSISDNYQWYEAAILCDSVLKVGTNADMTAYTLTTAGSWTYLGRYRGFDPTNMWFRKKNSETTAVSYSLIIWGISR